MDALERDYLDERRRKWRRSAFWRGFFVAIIGLVLIGLVVGLLSDPRAVPHIARIDINDVIYHDRQRNAFVAQLGDDENVRGVVVHISSPGGTAVGSETLYQTLRDVSDEKPLVTIMGEVAASGGYIASLASDHIIARGNTATGSIGVVMEYPDVTGLMDRIGVEMVTMRSSELKAGPSPFRELSEQARQVEEAMVADSYDWFKTLVSDRRGLTGADLDTVADGRVFTGRQALDAGLIDEIGDEARGLAYLETRDGALSDLPVVTWEQESEDGPISWLMGRMGLSTAGFPSFDRLTGPRLMMILK